MIFVFLIILLFLVVSKTMERYYDYSNYFNYNYPGKVTFGYPKHTDIYQVLGSL